MGLPGARLPGENEVVSFDRNQFRSLIRRTLVAFDPALVSDAAVELLMGTAAQESGLGVYLRQVGGGPALGVFQIEPSTFEYLKKRFGPRYPELIARDVDELEWDVRLSIIMARLKYRSIKAPLPENNVHALADYWKKFYNTELGDGTTTEFRASYARFCV